MTYILTFLVIIYVFMQTIAYHGACSKFELMSPHAVYISFEEISFLPPDTYNDL